MSIQTNKNHPFNKGDKGLIKALRSIWLGIIDEVRTKLLSMQWSF
jgi:hypothetical protein